ncbi:hypothetical protein B9479_005022 [Cryptococcus floricola]|uniref:WSC domain-containing protein n=1 Tax=Cryptococcus floricola TaxID=2591691 RepID=A0A5D3AWW5_9TREE|nr:hypothetical protein B9479_005022 [Cryptococcus floricola]
MLAALSVLLTFIPLVLAVNVPTLASGWEYVGCLYEGEGQRILNWTIYPSSGMTPAVCVTYCNNQGLPFAGLADADQCMCGSKLSNFQRVDEKNCNSTCAGNAQYECGGWGYISFYSLASKNPDPDATSSTIVATSSAKAVQTSTVVASAGAGAGTTTTVKEEAQTQTVVVTSVATDGEASGQVVTSTMVVSSAETTSEVVAAAEASTTPTSTDGASTAEAPSGSSQDSSSAASSATGGPTFSSASSSSLSTTSASSSSNLLPTYHASSTLFPSGTPRLKTPSVIFGLLKGRVTPTPSSAASQSSSSSLPEAPADKNAKRVGHFLLGSTRLNRQKVESGNEYPRRPPIASAQNEPDPNDEDDSDDISSDTDDDDDDADPDDGQSGELDDGYASPSYFDSFSWLGLTVVLATPLEVDVLLARAAKFGWAGALDLVKPLEKHASRLGLEPTPLPDVTRERLAELLDFVLGSKRLNYFWTVYPMSKEVRKRLLKLWGLFMPTNFQELLAGPEPPSGTQIRSLIEANGVYCNNHGVRLDKLEGRGEVQRRCLGVYWKVALPREDADDDDADDEDADCDPNPPLPVLLYTGQTAFMVPSGKSMGFRVRWRAHARYVYDRERMDAPDSLDMNDLTGMQSLHGKIPPEQRILSDGVLDLAARPDPDPDAEREKIQVTTSTKLGIERKFHITLRDLFVLFYVLLLGQIKVNVNPLDGRLARPRRCSRTFRFATP